MEQRLRKFIEIQDTHWDCEALGSTCTADENTLLLGAAAVCCALLRAAASSEARETPFTGASVEPESRTSDDSRLAPWSPENGGWAGPWF